MVTVVLELMSSTEIRAELKEEPRTRGGAPEWTPPLELQADQAAVKLLGEDALVSKGQTRVYRSPKPSAEWERVIPPPR